MIATRGMGAGFGATLPTFGMGAGYGGAGPAPDDTASVPNGWTTWQGTVWTGNPRQEEEIIILRRKISSRAGV